MHPCLSRTAAGLALVAILACGRDPLSTAPGTVGPNLAGTGPGPTGGALVANAGEGQDDAVCFFGGFVATSASSVRTPSGNATLSCHFEGLEPIPEVDTQTGWTCTIIHGGTSETSQTQWVRTTNGTADMTCQFSGKPVQNSAVVSDAGAFPAQEGSWTTSLGDIPGQALQGELVDVGRACNGDPLAADPAGRIALIERGACGFSDKVLNAFNAGAIGAVVYNSAVGGEQIVTMAGAVNVAIPAVFVARSTGLTLRSGAASAVSLKACGRSATCRGSL